MTSSIARAARRGASPLILIGVACSEILRRALRKPQSTFAPTSSAAAHGVRADPRPVAGDRRRPLSAIAFADSGFDSRSNSRATTCPGRDTSRIPPSDFRRQGRGHPPGTLSAPRLAEGGDCRAAPIADVPALNAESLVREIRGDLPTPASVRQRRARQACPERRRGTPRDVRLAPRRVRVHY